LGRAFAGDIVIFFGKKMGAVVYLEKMEKAKKRDSMKGKCDQKLARQKMK